MEMPHLRKSAKSTDSHELLGKAKGFPTFPTGLFIRSKLKNEKSGHRDVSSAAPEGS
jgi:hypothetical protein